MCEPGTELQLLLRRIADGGSVADRIDEVRERAVPLRAVVIETTGTTDPASIARLLLAQDFPPQYGEYERERARSESGRRGVILSIPPSPFRSNTRAETAAAKSWRDYYALTETYELKSIVAVFDVRRVAAQLAEPDKPDAPNAFRAQCLAADTVILSHSAEAETASVETAVAAVAEVRRASGSRGAGGAAAVTFDAPSSIEVVDDLRGPPPSFAKRVWRPMMHGAPSRFDASSVVSRRPEFLSPDVSACPWEKAFTVNFKSLEKVKRGGAIGGGEGGGFSGFDGGGSAAEADAPLAPLVFMEAGLAFEAPLRAMAAALSGSGGEVPEGIRVGNSKGVERFKGAFIVDRPEGRAVVVLEGGTGWCTVSLEPIPLTATYARPLAMTPAEAAGRHCRTLELEAANNAMAAASANDPGEFNAIEVARAPVASLFIVGRSLKADAVRRLLRACMVPAGFYLAADAEIDFGVTHRWASFVCLKHGSQMSDVHSPVALPTHALPLTTHASPIATKVLCPPSR